MHRKWPNPLHNARELFEVAVPEKARLGLTERIAPVKERAKRRALQTIGNEAFRERLGEANNKAAALKDIVGPAAAALQGHNWGQGNLAGVARSSAVLAAGLTSFKLAAKQLDRLSYQIETRCAPPKATLQKVQQRPDLAPPGYFVVHRWNDSYNLETMLAIAAARNWHDAEMFEDEEDLRALLSDDVAPYVYLAFRFQIPNSEFQLVIALDREIGAAVRYAQREHAALAAQGETPSPIAEAGRDEPIHPDDLLGRHECVLSVSAGASGWGNGMVAPWALTKHRADYQALTAAVTAWFWGSIPEIDQRVPTLAEALRLTELKQSTAEGEADAPQARTAPEATQLSRMLVDRYEQLRQSGGVRVVLLYGRSGLGKSVAAYQVAQHSKRGLCGSARDLTMSIAFSNISGPIRLRLARAPAVEGESPSEGSSEVEAARNRRHFFVRSQPHVIVLDELDAVLEDKKPREWMEELSSFRWDLEQLTSTAGSHCLIVLTANRPELLDPAFLRPGRIDEFVPVTPGQVGDARFAKLKDLPLTSDQLELASQWPVAYLAELRTRFKLYGADWEVGSAEVEGHVQELEWRRAEAEKFYGVGWNWKDPQEPEDLSVASDESMPSGWTARGNRTVPAPRSQGPRAEALKRSREAKIAGSGYAPLSSLKSEG